LAIIGGSFSSSVGGHNILEPCLYNCPVLFGPAMQTQKELLNIALKIRAGKQVFLNELFEEVLEEIGRPRSNLALRLEQYSQENNSAKINYDVIF